MSKTTATPVAPEAIRMTPYQRRKFLETQASRAKVLFPHSVMCSLFEEAAKKAEDSDYQAHVAKLYLEAYRERTGSNGRADGPKNLELNELRILTVNNFVTAMANFGRFFQQVTLGEADRPMIRNETGHEIDFVTTNVDGVPVLDRAPVVPGTNALPTLAFKSSRDYEYEILDLYEGNITGAAMMNIDMARDLAMDFNAIQKALVDTCIGDFDITNADKPSRVYQRHSSIVAANLPTTNAITVSGNTTSTTWRLACLKALLHYEAKWTHVMFADGSGPIFDTIFVPSADVTAFVDTISDTTEVNPITQQIFDNGYVMTLGGRSYNLIGDATLDPADGYAYAASSKPVGEWYSKPSLDGVIIDNSAALTRRNKESQYMRKVYGSGLPSNWRMNVARIAYRSQA